MTEAETKLAALWAEDAPPARDAAFRLQVLAKVERRRALDRLLLVFAAGLAIVVLGLMFMPKMSFAFEVPSNLLAEVTGAAALVWAIVVLAPRQLRG